MLWNICPEIYESKAYIDNPDLSLTISLVSEGVLCKFRYEVAATFTESYDACSYVENVSGDAA